MVKKAILLAVAVISAACGTTAATPASTPRAAQDAGGGGEAAAPNGEAPGVRYTNRAFHYRVDAPGAMKEQPDGAAAFLGPSERLEISVLNGSSAADPAALATADLPTLGSKSAFHLLNPPAGLTLAGRTVQKVVYSWTDGTNPVTSRPNALVSARYYIPRDRTTVAVVTYSIVANQYDPQGADDVVSTFTWQ